MSESSGAKIKPRVRVLRPMGQRAERRFNRLQKMSPELIERFCRLARKGVPPDAICDYLGVSAATFWGWIRKGEEFRQNSVPTEWAEYGDFVECYRKAVADYRISMITRVHSEHNPYWQRELAILERRDRRNWGRNTSAIGSDTEFDPDEKFL